MAEAEGVTFTPENLALPVDHPGAPFGLAEGRLAPMGEMNWHAIAKAFVKLGSTGPTGMEAFASTDPEAALEAFRTAFTVQRVRGCGFALQVPASTAATVSAQ